MKKMIFNTSLRSFFRELGKIFAYILCALLLYILSSHLGFVTIVNASEITTNVNYVRSGVINVPYDQKFDNSWIYKDFNSTTSLSRQEFQINFTDVLETNDVDVIEFTMLTSEPTTTELSNPLKGRYCNKYSSFFSGYVEGNIPTFDYECQSYSEYNSGETFTIVNNDYKLSNFNIYVITTDNQYLSCTITSTGKIQCPTNRKNLKSIVTHFIFKTNHLAHMRYAINIDYNLYINANGEIKKSVDDVKNTIDDDDVTSSSNTAGGFFDDFDDGDTGSLMNLVKLPLKFLNKLNNACTPIQVNTGYLDKFTIPCLSSYLYNVSGFAPIFNIVALVINGIIMYGCIKSIIETVQKLKDPNNDEVEVMDL